MRKKLHNSVWCASSNCQICQSWAKVAVKYAKEWAKDMEKALDYVKTENDKNIGKNGG